MTLKITSNSHERQFIYRHDVPADILSNQFDYLDADTFDGFLKYRGHWYHTSCFMRFGFPFNQVPQWAQDQGWDGYHSDSFFSGVVIKISDDCETYKIATFTS